MIITIKPLTKGLQPVYLGFFAIERFQTTILMGPATARPEHGYMASIRQMVSEFGSDIKGTLRRYAERLFCEVARYGNGVILNQKL